VNVAFFGTSAFGADVLRALVERGRLTITAVVSQPDRESGRGRRLTSPPVADAARELGIALSQPERASQAPPPADAGIVVAFGQIIREPLLSAYPLVNLHPSLLPRWRGAAPIERAIMAGDAETGVAVIALAAELDAGPVLAEQRFPIGERDDAGAVRARALELGVPLLETALLERPEPRAQSGSGATYAEKIRPDDRMLHWSRPAGELDRVVRALSPHIGARCLLDDRPFVVWRARPLDRGPSAGEVEAPLVVGCGQGALELLELQPAGKRRMGAEEFLRGLRQPPRRAS
jgi:methionyl-tRNA formyltransferase